MAVQVRRFTYAVSLYNKLPKLFSLESSHSQLLNSIKKADKNIKYFPTSTFLLIHS